MKSLLVFLIVSIVLPAHAGTLSGIPIIADADTAEFLPGTKVRLLDMDAPETDQFCLDKKGDAWNCGIAAREPLKEQVGGKQWNCEGTKYDRDRRLLASCIVENENISQWMVRHGWAMSPTKKGCSHRFDADEKLARDAQDGLWAGAFIAPQDWRYRNCKTEVARRVGPSDRRRAKTLRVTSSTARSELHDQIDYARRNVHLSCGRWVLLRRAENVRQKQAVVLFRT